MRCLECLALLVDPVLAVARPVDDLAVLEPQLDLLLGVLDAVRAVADVAAHLDREVATDGARQRRLPSEVVRRGYGALFRMCVLCESTTKGARHRNVAMGHAG